MNMRFASGFSLLGALAVGLCAMPRPACAQSAPIDDPAVSVLINTAHTGAAHFAKTPFLPPYKIHWTVDLNGAISYPLIVGGRVFATAGKPNSPNGTELYALDAATGKVLWGPVAITGTYFWSYPAYDAGKVFVLNFDGLLQAFSEVDGRLAWSQKMPGQYAFSAPPTAQAGTVYVGGAGVGGTLYAVDEATGTVKWTKGVANGDDSAPTLGDSGVVVSYPCQVYDFAADTGEALWHYSGACEGGGGATANFYNHQFYVRDWSSSLNGSVLDSKTGKIKARIADMGSSPPAFGFRNLFYVAKGALIARSNTTRTLQWKFSGDGTIVTAPILVNNTVFVGSSSGNLYALAGGRGALLQTLPLNAGAIGGMSAGEGLLVAALGNKLVAVGK